MIKRWKEWFSIESTNNPRRLILLMIIGLNILMVFMGAIIIRLLSIGDTETMPFLQAVFVTLSMMLDPGCISMVVEDVGRSGMILAIFCFIVVIFGMISFTGMVIGYVTTYIAAFLEKSQSSSNTLIISDHFVVMNWNNRASEIVNDLLYLDTPQKVVVMVSEGRERVQRQIEEKIAATIKRENELMAEHLGVDRLPRRLRMKNRLTVIVREGDLFSNKMLMDAGIDQAKTIIILGSDENTAAQDDQKARKGNVHTIKTLMQVADITGAQSSRDDQNIIVEITDSWTMTRVQHIIDFKQVEGKCNITPISINQILGQILCQFTIIPELNGVYNQLFSNYGATIFSEKRANLNEAYVGHYLSNHTHAIPLIVKRNEDDNDCYFMARSQKDVQVGCAHSVNPMSVQMSPPEKYDKKTIVIIGANSCYEQLMEGFQTYLCEWPDCADVIVIDDRETLEKNSHYQRYPFVVKTIPVEDHDSEGIRDSVKRILTKRSGDISVLILSDDRVSDEDIDADALSNLIFIQTILSEENVQNQTDRRIDVIVELIDPRHHDIVTSYNVDNVVISNRYVSKMITQIGEKETLYKFFSDILTYDNGEEEEYSSKEIYVRKAMDIFTVMPEKMTAHQLVRAVAACPDNKANSVLMGYIRDKNEICLFSGDLSEMEVELLPEDKLILFSAHI